MGRRVPWRGRRSAVVLALVAATLVSVGTTAASQEAAPPVVPGTPCTATATACVDLVGLRAWLFQDGQVLRGPVPISIGAGGEARTPAGRFRVEWKNRDHVSGESGGPMPFAVFFAPGGIAFHEGNLQTKSAGCVRLSRDEASAFFDHLQVGDEVQVHDDPAPA
ncbi:L,D-transpeptidase [Pseudonocardia sp. KRD-188]|uniref:L,D-transpeptidase n=3 Tax=Pseudonocardia oceani TaxID=2792013 RepID=A0ABS6U2P1_9PSEU|nr:L,D-transpeptidase [Pseudonocardia oceani]MBW0126517.1 L,D-transpeptidase [Pseudonocardia oceani]